MRCSRKWATVVGAMIVVVLSATGCGTGEETTSTVTVTQPATPKSAEAETGNSKPVESSEPSESSEPTDSSATASQENALESAESYLEYTAFSESGLEEQLKSEGFSTADAQYGASHTGADWNEQAVKSAESYLEYTSFSESGLVGQLKSEGFTSSQAEYGVSKAYH